MQKIVIQPLAQAAFAPFGEVIQSHGAPHYPINNATFERYHALGNVELAGSGDAHGVISIFKCNQASSLPYSLTLMEKHPEGSQAIIPWSDVPFIIAVAKDDAAMQKRDIFAFESNGKQGINMGAGIWHMPLIAPTIGLEFLVVDREGPGGNCVEVNLDPPLLISR